MSFTLHHGDSLHILAELPDNSVDAVVTDPPYGFAFMGKKWDYDLPPVELWEQVLRVLKPGGHMLAFGGSRTYHRMVCAVEDAGFEIRDCVMWIYGQGFPKSLNLRKTFCECKMSYARPEPYTYAQGAESPSKHDLRFMPDPDLSKEVNAQSKRGQILQSGMPKQSTQDSVLRREPQEGTQVRKESRLEGRGDEIQEKGQLHRSALCASTGMGEADGKARRIHHGASVGHGDDVRQVLNKNGSGQSQRPQSEQQSSEQSGAISRQRHAQESGMGERCPQCRKPILPEGFNDSRIDGWGTALKPAHEPIVLARKPLSERNVAANVLRWGTGGVNVDGCRVESASDDDKKESTAKNQHEDFGTKPMTNNNVYGDYSMVKPTNYNPPGRFPANVIHDGSDEVLAGFPVTTSGKPSAAGHRRKASNGYVSGVNIIGRREDAGELYGDTGSAARFFYCAKSSRREREAGCEGMPIKQKVFNGQSDHSAGMAPGSVEDKFTTSPARNAHPTVKPISLMRYLCRLITPPNGIILDPFTGSGTTGCAAMLEGFRFIGIEREAEYVEIARRRIEHWREEADEEVTDEQPELFEAYA